MVKRILNYKLPAYNENQICYWCFAGAALFLLVYAAMIWFVISDFIHHDSKGLSNTGIFIGAVAYKQRGRLLFKKKK